MVTKKLPENLKLLSNIVNNLWWSWNQDIWPIFERLNPTLWQEEKNPILLLNEASDETLNLLSNDKEYVANLQSAANRLDSYLNKNDLWFEEKYSNHVDNTIAYFSAEYGIHESLKIYSGGLGVLSGDHVKSASDLGLPIAFVGLFYHQGYFQQHIDAEGKQVDEYIYQDPKNLPMELVTDDSSNPILIDVELASRTVYSQIWKVNVGRSPLYLLDSDIKENSEEDRKITARLYGGDREMRISQEIILGIGGVRALYALGINPKAYHMNEGHSAFFQLERIKKKMENENLSYNEAKALVSSNCLFTTHTPVPAGNEAFELPLLEKYFYNYVTTNLKISWGEFVNLGLISESSDYKYFSLTILAINLANYYNGVSKLHGQIAQKMWKGSWPSIPESENPISSVTNGIHTQTWCSHEIKALFNEYVGADWEDQLSNHSFWEKAYNLPHDQLRATRHKLKAKMIEMVRHNLKGQLKRNGETSTSISEVDTFLNPNLLTIGFARRFATYKRATLIFKDPDRLASIVNNPDYPVQFVFAGKAHPADTDGQKFIQDIYKYSREERFKGKIIILENYDMNISRHMVSAVDVWLNNPRRPMEASGTSGQKVPINGGLNFSVLDGWWKEGYNGENGWTIGFEKDYPNEEGQDHDDANNFYDILQQTIVPLYYRGDHEESEEWIKKSLISLVTNISNYSTHRMVQDYSDKFYVNAIESGEDIGNSDDRKIYLDNVNAMKHAWPSIAYSNFKFEMNETNSRYDEFKNTPSHHTNIPYDYTIPGRVFVGKSSNIQTEVYLSGLDPKKVVCQAIITHPNGELYEYVELEMTKTVDQSTYLYKANLKFDGEKHLRLRIFPKQVRHHAQFDLGLTSWL